MKVGKILGCLNFGSADSPPLSADGPPMHRQASVTPMVCPLSKRGRSAKEHGQSAHAVFRWSQAAKLIMSYKGISLVDHIHLGAYEMLELDIYALIACYKMFEWIKCL
jgi:hypothetical protein